MTACAEAWLETNATQEGEGCCQVSEQISEKAAGMACSYRLPAVDSRQINSRQHQHPAACCLILPSWIEKKAVLYAGWSSILALLGYSFLVKASSIEYV